MKDPDLMRVLDREAIRDCLYRYCRGIDRADEAALRSSYWPDATDRHGASSGPVEGFFERVQAAWARGVRNVHHVGNILIELKGDGFATVESYFLALQRGRGPDGIETQVLISGRYCDLFAKRDGEWRVLERVVVYDWVDHQTPATGSEDERFGARLPIGGRCPDDPAYWPGRDFPTS
ncbi:nuclear transport factor 2 family protein [Mesorhizobium xinjiangense]|uniref:nuclear transport factor 2 family protein n=1 Tax=Mesorhizobium xinjiangense TaxID=2678685 RepID=UPI0012ED09EE|nr:nuclear transport factor 2 family protein [Mesorhizobium xinjiangense]